MQPDTPDHDDRASDEHRSPDDPDRAGGTEPGGEGEVDPEAPGAALVDPTIEPAEPNEPG